MMKIQNGKLLFVNETDLDSEGALHIPEGVTVLDKNVGNAIPGLRAVYFPNSLKTIDAPAFWDNPYLEKIHFGDDTEELKADVFWCCPKIKHLRIPGKWKNLGIFSDSNCSNLNTVTRHTQFGEETYKIKTIDGQQYYEKHNKNIFGYQVFILHKLRFYNDPTIDYFAICINKAHFISSTLENVVQKVKTYKIEKAFAAALYKYECGHPEEGDIYDIKQLILIALHRTLINLPRINYKQKRILAQYCKNIPLYVKQLKDILSKYPRAKNDFYELQEISLEDLADIITPRTVDDIKNKKCTKKLKNTPVSQDEMVKMVQEGYKNPGAFPYAWIKQIAPYRRGAATEKLHNAIRKAAIKMYSPDNYSITEFDKPINKLQKELSKITHQPVKVEFLSAGNFGKTFKIQIADSKKDVLKIYHCNRSYIYVHNWGHDNELQNSFLLSGKKYKGNIKFRKISTAGISNQRGERYLIYPFVDKTESGSPFDKNSHFKRVSLYDFNSSENLLGNTIIDTGAIQINEDIWRLNKRTAKVLKTILYHSWDDLSIVLGNYTNEEIKLVTDLIRKKLKEITPGNTKADKNTFIMYKQIKAKADFLSNKLYSRGCR